MKKTNKTINPLPIFLLVICSIALSICFVVFTGQDGSIDKISSAIGADATTETQTESTEPPIIEMAKVKTVSVGATGDVLIHEPIYKNAYNSADGSYDFSNIFEYSQNYIKNCDYFVANLEVTLGGTENGKNYSSYPIFNTPDELAQDLKDAGIDMVLTANNHCYDSGFDGVLRTQEIVKSVGLDSTGTISTEGEKNYSVVDVDGVKLGMINYTYETVPQKENVKYINGLEVGDSAKNLINSFDYADLDSFYSDIEANIESMRADGAMAIVVYLHWGDEYKLEENHYQNEMAQKLCDMGVDIIVGGHPHVIQPIELVSSTQGDHKMVVAYSLGNAVSNQRRAYMGLKTGNTEDGMFLKMNFTSYTDGSALLESIEVVPTWVNLYTDGGKQIYNVLAIGEADDDANGITGKDTDSLIASYDRTMALVGEGMNECNDWLKTQAENKLLEEIEPTQETEASTELAA